MKPNIWFARGFSARVKFPEKKFGRADFKDDVHRFVHFTHGVVAAQSAFAESEDPDHEAVLEEEKRVWALARKYPTQKHLHEGWLEIPDILTSRVIATVLWAHLPKTPPGNRPSLLRHSVKGESHGS